MVRLRLAALAAAAGIGLVGGCFNLSHRPLFGRRGEPAPTTPCVEAGPEGPVLGSVDPGLPPPPNLANPSVAYPAPQPPKTFNAGQAQTMPYSP